MTESSPSSPADHPMALARHPAALPLLFGVAAFLLVAWTTPWGIGTTPDSATYFEAARNLATGRGYVSDGRPLTLYPPLYPALLALFAGRSDDPVGAARWMHALLAFGNAAVCVAIARRAAGGSAAAAIACGVLWLASFDMLLIQTVGLSEPLFLLLATSGLFALHRHASEPSPMRLAAGTALVASAMLTRFAGLPLAGIGAAGVLLLGTAPMRSRLRDAAIVCLGAGLPTAAWMLRNRLAAGPEGSPPIAWHPVGWEQLRAGLDAACSWATPPSLPLGLRAAALAVAVGATVRMGIANRASAATAWAGWGALFAVGYVGFVILSISIVYANTPLDYRLLGPVLQVGLTALAATWASCIRAPRWRAVAACVAAAACIANLARTVPTAIAVRAHGFGYTTEAWRKSPAIEAVRALPPETILHSNAPDAIRLLARRPATAIPQAVDPQRKIPNPNLDSEVDALLADMRRGAIVVYFERGFPRPHLMREEELRARLGNAEFRDVGDATMLRLKAEAPPP